MGVADPGGLSDAEREHFIGLLREHFAAGQFEVPEFTRRIEMVFAASTTSQASRTVEDLPALQGTRPQPRRSWWRRLAGGRHAQTDAALIGWLPTAERFRDPSSGDLMRVWVDPADNSRHYVPEDPHSS